VVYRNGIELYGNFSQKGYHLVKASQTKKFTKSVEMIIFRWGVTTVPSTGIDVIAPGRKEFFLENCNPISRSREVAYETYI